MSGTLNSFFLLCCRVCHSFVLFCVILYHLFSYSFYALRTVKHGLFWEMFRGVPAVYEFDALEHWHLTNCTVANVLYRETSRHTCVITVPTMTASINRVYCWTSLVIWQVACRRCIKATLYIGLLSMIFCLYDYLYIFGECCIYCQLLSFLISSLMHYIP